METRGQLNDEQLKRLNEVAASYRRLQAFYDGIEDTLAKHEARHNSIYEIATTQLKIGTLSTWDNELKTAIGEIKKLNAMFESAYTKLDKFIDLFAANDSAAAKSLDELLDEKDKKKVEKRLVLFEENHRKIKEAADEIEKANLQIEKELTSIEGRVRKYLN